MRRNLVSMAALTVVLGGCSIFSAHTNVAASAAGQDFTSQQMATLLTSGKGVPLNTQTAELVANIWVDLTVFSQAVANNTFHPDSTQIAEAMWLPIVLDKARSLKDSLVSNKADVSQAEIDSAWKADKQRVIQHILIKADSTSTPAEKAAARKKIDSLLNELHKGADFGVLARANSEDVGSVADSGMMPPVPENFFVPSFSKTAWALKPGQISGVVTTEFGYHIIRRPTQAEAARMWRQALAQDKYQQLGDSLVHAYIVKLGKDKNLTVDHNAIPRVRAAVADLNGKRDDHSTLATYTGGTFTTADFVHWVEAANSDPSSGQQLEAQLRAMPDSMLPQVITGLAGSQLLINDADQRKITVAPATWEAIRDSFNMAVDTLKADLGLDKLDPSASKGERSKMAATMVSDYLDSLVQGGGRRLHLPPGLLAWDMRANISSRIDGVGLKHAIDLALARTGGDSVSTGPMEKAPGPAPTPGAGATRPQNKPAPAPGDTGKGSGTP
jgi:PPIC-type PPIASE domain